MEEYIRKRSRSPYYNVLETTHSFLLELDLPGLSDKKAVDIEFTDRQTLVVKGKIVRNTPTPTSDKTTSSGGGDGGGDGGNGDTTTSTDVPGYQATEMSFERTFQLHRTIDQDYAYAKLADGVLAIVLPKALSKKIEVQ